MSIDQIWLLFCAAHIFFTAYGAELDQRASEYNEGRA